MTLFEFGKLSTHEQFVALWDYGQHLGYRRQGEYYFAFYQLQGLYLELKYNAVTKTVEGYKGYSNPNVE
jgi:hypothetical protein